MDRGAGWLQSMGSQRVKDNWATKRSMAKHSVYMLKTNVLIYPLSLSPLITVFCFLCLWVYFYFAYKFICISLDCIVSDIIWYFRINLLTFTISKTWSYFDWDYAKSTGHLPGVGNGNIPQYSCLENFMVRGAWPAVVHGVADSHTWLSMHACMHSHTGHLMQTSTATMENSVVIP